MYMDPLRLAIALGPLAAYLLVLGAVNLSARPFLTSGAKDTAALGLAVGGLAIAGPMELFFPESAAVHLGAWIWLLLIGFYALCLTLLILLMRPRLVIYNVTVDQLRPLLAEVVSDVDAKARWVGDSLILPRLNVQLHVEPFAAMKNVQLVSSGPRQSHAGWRRLEDALAPALRQASGSPSPYGLSLTIFGLLMAAVVAIALIGNPQAVALQLNEMLRR
jgi:hypothetical protein